MEGKLIKVDDVYRLVEETKHGNSIIGITDLDYQKSWSNRCQKLSLKNCQAIENGYDLDDKISKHLEKNDIEASTKRVQVIKELILEILGDKRFSEEHLKVAADWYYETKGKKSIDEYIQSLQQTEWDVIIEMECPQCKEWGYVSECRNNCNQKFLQLKLDADGCLILKRK